jgi:hypothetical protein
MVYNDPVAAGEQWDLGLFDRSGPYEVLQVTFDVGSAAATTPWVGIYAEAFDIGTFDFSLRADDGLAPPPVPEPSTLAMAFAGLITVFGLSRRRLAWAGPLPGPFHGLAELARFARPVTVRRHGHKSTLTPRGGQETRERPFVP